MSWMPLKRNGFLIYGEEGISGKEKPDLCNAFFYRKHHVKFHWVKGHADTPENNRCDD